MAEMTEEEFLSQTAPDKRVTAEQIQAAAVSAPPSSAAAEFAQRRNAQDLSRLAPGAETVRQKLGEEPGVPLDIDSGLGAGVQFELGRRRTEKDKLHYLASQYDAGNIRLNDKGDAIVRSIGPDGKPRDTLVDHQGLNISDLGTLAAHAPELVGAILGPAVLKGLAGLIVKGSGRAAELGLLGTSFGSAVGAQTAGALQDAQMRLKDAVPLQMGEIIVERGKGIMADTAAQLALGGGLKGISILEEAERTGQIPSPIKLLRGPLQKEGVEAAARISQRTGLPMELSAGQSTGNPFIASAEAYLETKQSGAGPALAARARREAQRTNLQDWMTDPSTLPLDEEVGRKGIGILTDLTETSNAAVQAAKQRVEQEGQIAIKDLLSQRFNQDVAPNPAVIAKTLRNSGIEAKEAFDVEVGQRYNALWSHPKANTPDVTVTRINQAADELLEAWPKDPATGELITRNAPEGLLAKVREAANLGKGNSDTIIGSDEFGLIKGPQQAFEGKMSLRELAGLRTFLDQNITGGQAIAGIKEGKLVALRSAVNNTIKEAAAKDPALNALYHRANDFYAENASRFNNKLIDQLFKRPEHEGYIGDAEFLQSLSQSSDKYKRIQQFFGRSSDEMRLVNREIADTVMRDSLRSGFGDELSAEALRGNMAKLYDNKKTRDVFYGVFGKRADGILVELETLEKVGKLKGRNISARELSTSLDPDAVSRPSVQALLDSQLDNELLYANNVVKRFVKGEINVTAIRDEEFVNNWLANADLQDAKEVMGMIRAQDPLLAEQIGRKETQKFFREASRQMTPLDVLHELQSGTGSMPSGIGMGKLLGNKDNQAKLKEVMGSDRFELLKDFIKVELTEDEKIRLAKGTGIMTRGGVISAFLNKGFNVGEVKDWMKTKAISYMLNSPVMSSWLSSGYKAGDLPDLFKVLVTSEPFVAAVADDLKNSSRAFEMISALKHAAFGRDKQQAAPQRSQVPTMTEQEFLNSTRNP